MELKCKNKSFSNNFTVSKQGKQIGRIEGKTFSNKINGYINDNKIGFRPRGFFKVEIDIINLESGEKIGEIQTSNFMNKAKINFNTNDYHWSYTDGLSRKWSLSFNGIEIANYRKQTITSQSDDELLLLVGLYVHAHFRQRTALLLVVLLPVWIQMFNP